MKMDLIYRWRDLGRPGHSLPLSPSKNWTAKCHCSLWPVMGNVRCGISLSLALFTISYFTACPACQSAQTNLSETSSFATPIPRYSEQYVIYFSSTRFLVRGSKLSILFPDQTSTSPFIFFFMITANKLISNQIHVKYKDNFPSTFPLRHPQAKHCIIC